MLAEFSGGLKGGSGGDRNAGKKIRSALNLTHVNDSVALRRIKIFAKSWGQCAFS